MGNDVLTDPRYSSAVVLLAIAALLVLVGLLYQVGALGRLVEFVFFLMRAAVNGGFALWRRTLTWMSWHALLAIVAVAHLVLLAGLGSFAPAVVVIGGALLVLGVVTCLAYVFIDSERDEVERGYKVLHSPLKGQQVAQNLVVYGHRAGFMLLVAATLACVAGFALLNFGLYNSVGRSWYDLSAQHSRFQANPLDRLFGRAAFLTSDYSDFLVYTFLQLTNVVDLLDVTNRMQIGQIAFVRPARWPSTTLLVLFRAFFTLVLLQQIFAAIRRARVLSEAVRDFWSPYEPIQRRAADNLRQQGGWAAEQLLQALETVTPLTADQRTLLPQLLAGMGPSTIPVLERNLKHANPEVRAACVAALGRLEAWRALAEMVLLAGDGEESVRLGLADALGFVCQPGAQMIRKRWSLQRRPARRWLARLTRRKGLDNGDKRDPIELAVDTLRRLLGDESRPVRVRAAEAVAAAGQAGSAAVGELAALARDENAEARAAAARALGAVKGIPRVTLQALLPLLDDPTPTVLVPAAEALGALGAAAASALPALIPLVQHAEDDVRAAAAAAIGAIGKLDHTHVPQLIAGLTDEDNLVRSRAAEALGSIGPAVAMTAPDLVLALKDENDRVRARAAWALGQLGPEPANLSVPGLKHALEDADSRVAAVAAEGLGNLGEAARPAADALLAAAAHINATVRTAAAAAALRLGLDDENAVACYAKLAVDEEATVRRQGVLCLGAVGRPDAGIDGMLYAAREDADPQVRAAAVKAIGQRSAGDSTLLGAVLKSTEDVDPTVRAEAAAALGTAEDVPVAIVEHLGGLLGDTDEEVQRAAAAALGKLGPRAESATEPLHELLKTGTAELREHAIRALVHIMPPGALDAFTTAMHDAEPQIRRLASAGLMKLKEVPPETLPLLAEGLKDADVQVRSNVAYVCGKLAELPEELVPPLLESTADQDDGLRLNAVRALQNVPITGTEEALMPLLDDTNPQIGLLAARALLARDPAHARAWEAIGVALNSPSPAVREQAAGVAEACAADPEVVNALIDKCAAGEECEPLRQRLGGVLDRLAKAAAEPAAPPVP